MTAIKLPISNRAKPSPLRSAFMKWQCRVRQNAMRDNFGRPDDGIMPALFLPDQEEPLGHIITVMNKSAPFSVTPELKHMLHKTNDPAQRRDQAIRYFSATYYQKAQEFSDTLTASFSPKSETAEKIAASGRATLKYDAFSQQFDLTCNVRKLSQTDALFESTFTHNRLFNPELPPDTIILGFTPDWDNSTSVPEYR